MSKSSFKNVKNWGMVIKVENFKAECFLGHKGLKLRRGGLRPNGHLDIKAKNRGGGVLRPNGP